MSEHELTVVGLDLGSRSMKALMVAVDEGGSLHYLAGVQMPSSGMRDGMVSHPARAARMVVEALERLEEESQTRIGTACVSVNGAHMRSQILRGETPVASEDGIIGHDDIQRVRASIREQHDSDTRQEWIHIIPRVYEIDGMGGFQNPLDLSGSDLAVTACGVSAPHVVSQSLRTVLEMARVEPQALLAAPLAAGESLRAQAGEGLPIAVVDLGAQTTGVAIYTDDALWACGCLPVGSDTITQHIARELRFPVEVAERLKCDRATCIPSRVAEDDFIEMNQVSGDDELLPAQQLAETAREGAMEIVNALVSYLRQEQRAGVTPAALWLTGGGAELEGLPTLLEGTLHIPVTVAGPAPVLGAPSSLYSRPAFAVATGLTRLAARRLASEPVHTRRGATLFGTVGRWLHNSSRAPYSPHGRGAARRW